MAHQGGGPDPGDGHAAQRAEEHRHRGGRGDPVAGQVADGQQGVPARQRERVVPVAADQSCAGGREVVRGHVERGRPVVGEVQRAAPGRQDGLLEFDGDPALGALDVPAALQARPALPDRPLAAPQFADVAQDGPHGGGAAVGVEDGFARHVDGAHPAVGPYDPELAVDRLPVDQAVRHHPLEEGLVLGEDHRGHLVERHRAVLPGAPEHPVQLLGPADLVGEQVPLGAADPGEERAGARRCGQAVRGAGIGREVRVLDGLSAGLRPRRHLHRHARAQLPQLGAEVVELVHGEVAQGALPPLPRVVLVRRGVPADGVDLAAQAAGLRDQRVHRARLRRLGGTVREQRGRHVVLRYRRGAATGQEGARVRLLHSPGRPVRGLATLDPVVLLTYAKGPVSVPRGGADTGGRRRTGRGDGRAGPWAGEGCGREFGGGGNVCEGGAGGVTGTVPALRLPPGEHRCRAIRMMTP